MASSKAPSLRQVRERELVAATRALFDEKGMQDAPVEEIAQAAGIARGLIYRHFSSRDELYVLTVTDYLQELAGELEAGIAGANDPRDELERCTRVFAGYCGRYPAFLDSSLALMRGPARELQQSISDSVWLRLGQGMGRCLGILSAILKRGIDTGTFGIEDPDFMANFLWTHALGTMHLARIRVGVAEAAPGIPSLFPVEPDQVVDACVATAMATVGVSNGAPV